MRKNVRKKIEEILILLLTALKKMITEGLQNNNKNNVVATGKNFIGTKSCARKEGNYG